MCFICIQYVENVLTRYDAEMLYKEHRHEIGPEHAEECVSELKEEQIRAAYAYADDVPPYNTPEGDQI